MLLVPPTVVAAALAPLLNGRRTGLVDPVHDGHQEGRSLPGPGLSARHQVALAQNYRDRVFLQ